MQRAKAFETDDGALRCYLDQLPVDRCLFCARPQTPRALHVQGPLHQWTEMHEMADTGSVGDKLMVAGALITGGRGGVRAYSQQTKGMALMSVCLSCAPAPTSAYIATAVAGGAAVLCGALGLIIPTVVASLATVIALVVASKRSRLAVGEIDEDDFMFKLHRVDDGVKTEVLALGAAPHPANKTTAQLRG